MLVEAVFTGQVSIKVAFSSPRLASLRRKVGLSLSLLQRQVLAVRGTYVCVCPPHAPSWGLTGHSPGYGLGKADCRELHIFVLLQGQ